MNQLQFILKEWSYTESVLLEKIITWYTRKTLYIFLPVLLLLQVLIVCLYLFQPSIGIPKIIFLSGVEVVLSLNIILFIIQAKHKKIITLSCFGYQVKLDLLGLATIRKYRLKSLMPVKNVFSNSGKRMYPSNITSYKAIFTYKNKCIEYTTKIIFKADYTSNLSLN